MGNFFDNILNDNSTEVYSKYRKIKMLCTIMNIINIIILIYIIVGSIYMSFSNQSIFIKSVTVIIEILILFIVYILNEVQEQLKLLNKRIVKILERYVEICNKIGRSFGLDIDEFNSMPKYKKYKFAEKFCKSHCGNIN